MSAAPRVFYAGRLRFSAQWGAERHAHPFIEILVVLTGHLEVWIGGRQVQAGSGDVLVYPAGVAHAERSVSSRPIEFYCLALKAPAPVAVAELTPDLNGRIQTLARWMVEESGAALEGGGQGVDSFGWALWEELGRLGRGGTRGPLARARARLRGRLQDPPSLDELAREAGLSRCYFIRRYKGLTGRTPMADLRLARLEAACDLLLTTELPLKAIAQRVGFCDEYYFSRAFRQQYEVPPGAFRGRRP